MSTAVLATPSNTLNIQNIIFGVENGATGQAVAVEGKIGIGEPAPQERLDVAGAVKIGTNNGATISDGSTLPVPNGGAGTMVFQNGHFFGWTGAEWKQLDN